jgi:hypothetical protein
MAIIVHLLLIILVALFTCRPILASDNVVVENTREKSSEERNASSSRIADSTNTCQADTSSSSSSNGTDVSSCHNNASSFLHLHSQCRVWVAMSTLPGSGIGMFAGTSFERGEELMRAGDHLIPIIDLLMYHQRLHRDNSTAPPLFLWDDYTWDGSYLGCDTLGRNDVTVASPGVGAVSNCVMDFINVDEGKASRESVPQQLHRSKDPGAGAFTYYHSRMAEAATSIEPGQELFVAYGDHW